MNARLSPFLSVIALSALAFLLTLSSSQAGVITLTGGDPADASDNIGYAPTGTLVEAYRISATNSAYSGAADQSAYTYKGITFQPFLLNGGNLSPTSATTTVGTATITNGFFYQAGSLDNTGTGGVHDSDDTALYNVTKYQSFATSGNYGDHGGTQTLTLSGLAHGATYQVDVFTANISGGDEYLYTLTGDSGALPTDDVVPTNARAAFIVYDVREDVVADINGQITVSVTDNLHTSDNATINAFSVEFIPEPASLGLLACGSLLMLRRRRAA